MCLGRNNGIHGYIIMNYIVCYIHTIHTDIYIGAPVRVEYHPLNHVPSASISIVTPVWPRCWGRYWFVGILSDNEA